ncbi:uncharacterized protein [Oncorhynchus clarkii lewisi]|uniref:uncharacterized protein n=1 Tax=Oncorhynchus clarkii lewisi TaxID=490388 RepID=UPI0039B9C52A
MARGPPGGILGVLGGVVAAGLIIAVAVTVFMVYRRQQKTRTETDNDLIAVAVVAGTVVTQPPPSDSVAPPPEPDTVVTQATEKPESPTRKVMAPVPSLPSTGTTPPRSPPLGPCILLPACNGGLKLIYLSTRL